MSKTIMLTAADGHTLSAYTSGTESATRGVVVLQEIFGLNDHIKKVADTFAAAGYKAIAPALFDRLDRNVALGYSAEERERGIALRRKLSDELALADAVAAAEALGMEASSIAVVGYCLGGTFAWLGATRTRSFGAASCWYGGGIAATKDETPNCPVQMHFGEMDGSIPPTDIAAIKAAQPSADIYVYPDAGHGFGCDERDSFVPQSYALAQDRTLNFFTGHLK